MHLTCPQEPCPNGVHTRAGALPAGPVPSRHGRCLTPLVSWGAMSEQWFERDPLWFKRAVFYEIHIRGFFDGNDDGYGDFRGLIDKLDYLEWPGRGCI